MLDDFMFCGRTTTEMGAIAAFGDRAKTGSKLARGEYRLPGGGSVILGDGRLETTERSVTIVPADGVQPTAQWRRRILSWLQAGRGEFVLLSDPEVMQLAQFDAPGTWGTRAWPDGALELTMTLQPLVYARWATAHTVATQSGAARIVCAEPTAMPMPPDVRIAITSGTVTSARICAAGRCVALEGMSLGAGGVISLTMGQLLTDAVGLTIDGEGGYAYVTSWAQLRLSPGEALAVELAGGEADVTLICRGRWLA